MSLSGDSSRGWEAPTRKVRCDGQRRIATTHKPLEHLNRQLVKESEQTIDEQVTAEEASGTRGNWRTSNRLDEQATGAQATSEPATGEQTTGEQATGEQAIVVFTNRFDEQATGEQATCEQATGEQTTGEQATCEQATGEQTIGALKRSFLTEVPMVVFTREVSFKNCLLNKPLFIVGVHSLYSKSSNLTVGTSNCHALDHQHHPQHDHQQQLQQQSQHLLSKENT